MKIVEFLGEGMSRRKKMIFEVVSEEMSRRKMKIVEVLGEKVLLKEVRSSVGRLCLMTGVCSIRIIE